MMGRVPIAWEFSRRHLFIYSIMHSTLSFLAMELKPEKRQVRLQAMLVQIRRCFQAEVHFDRGVSREIRQIKFIQMLDEGFIRGGTNSPLVKTSQFPTN